LCTVARGFEVHGNVIAVTDGDTIKVLDDQNTTHSVRLDGIDAPERGQPFSTQAKKALSGLVFAKNVTVTYTSRDRYGRII
jgi:endonuclease YncB( thermonuclease family)